MSDPAWKAVPRNAKSFLVWRIENFQVVPVPKEQYGTFYQGDAYILYSSRHPLVRGPNGQAQEQKGSLQQNVHFWLGSECTQDEEGTAAIKTVELDDELGGAPTQYREVEGHETKHFLNYFKAKGGVRYLKGGCKSGFNHVEHVVRERLLHVKGKINVRVREMDLEWSSFNEGDVFIVDLGSVLFVWTGKDASRTEKMKGMSTARAIRDERGGKADIITVESGHENEMTDAEQKLFSSKLPLNKRTVKPASEGGSDEEVARAASQAIKLYKCTDEGGTLKVTEVKSGPLDKKDLDTNDSYIVDNGEAGIWVWNGKKASPTEKKEAMRNAMGFASKKGYPKKTQVSRVSEFAEPTEFKVLFRTWPQPVATGKIYSQNRIAKTVQTKFDANTMHSNTALAAETGMVDDGSGTVEVWRIENFELVPVDKKQYGQFYGGDCYDILYTYNVSGKEKHIIYYWQGTKATQDEKGASALKAVELDDKYGGEPVQIRVVQNKEPAHFMSMFGGRMVVFEGGKGGWGAGGEQGHGDSYLLQVRGTTQLNTKAVQVDLRAASLNSNDVFVLITKTAVFIWCGKGSTGDEREMAKHVSKLSPRDPTLVFEGQEKDDFWKAIGGKEEYASDKRLAEEKPNHPPRLFQASNASGQFSVSPVPDFTQDDLNEDDVMILDAWDQIFVWIGKGANKQERDQAGQAAIEYIKTDPSGRDPDTACIQLKQGYEPPTFTGFFGAWDNDLWNKGKTFEELKQELGAGNMGVEVIHEKQANGNASFSDVAKYPYSDLIKKDVEEGLPSNVDTASKEIYLSTEEFKKVFSCTYEEFLGKPAWKQQQMKKSAGLF